MRKKTFAVPAFALLTCALPGCVVDSTTEVEDGIAMPGAAPESAPVDTTIATLELSGGKVVFVDEGDGVAFFEVGNVDLTSLLEDQKASALEVFLALAPEGTPAPTRLVEHHAEVVARTGTVPAVPRKLAPMFVMPEVQSLTNDPLTSAGPNCWGWGGSGTYTDETGLSGFSLSSFQSGFKDSYSQITGNAFQVSNGATLVSSPEANGSSPPVSTSMGHERAMAFCASQAIPNAGSCDDNRIEALVYVQHTNESGTNVFAGSVTLYDFGEGARFRSNYTNSGGVARRYTATVTFSATDYENLHGVNPTWCQDQVAVVWRSKHTGGSIITP
ncbi:hypothetical protein [Polyangium mundeleinium]|uniref:Lipoprotein n=1 Tax=Polyangium mundeleinium TaxID=2995306 RepID=A0ABT5F0I2_9BACT|nr:hypothetical protein [Polyangium mundeleinium]MDC0747583.1 hypothetical protein [Polyangium mundeleinium]